MNNMMEEYKITVEDEDGTVGTVTLNGDDFLGSDATADVGFILKDIIKAMKQDKVFH